MSGNKRSVEWVDLTSSSPPPQAKHARVDQLSTPPISSQPDTRSSLSSQDYLGLDSEETDIVDLSQDVDEGVIMGVINGKIVGIRYYNGYANPGEQVMVKREPSNQYDSNAIRIDNVQGAQIGHIPRKVALHLAPYMVGCSCNLVIHTD
jgi:SWI/SNF-related matrix-associated actin-dependent regulator of chromatin subfamily A3